MKVVTVVGARPQFIKAAAVSRSLVQSGGVVERLVHTGQHYDDNMSAVFFHELGIPEPAFNLGIGSASQGAQTGRMLEAIESVLIAERPDAVLVYGDTNSTLAGALAATKLHIRLAHVEAGLRSRNRRMPEEMNRILTDHAADLLLAPTAAAVENLSAEGIPATRIEQVGDVMYDTALYFRDKAVRESEVLTRLGLTQGHYVLATIHRAENTDDGHRLQAILGALGRVADQMPVVLPLHPRTRHAAAKLGIEMPPAIRLIEPVGYLDMVMLEAGARAIATDSGGVQKEAYFFKCPCVTLREETEWVELVENGWNHLVPPSSAELIAERLLQVIADGTRPPWSERLYGDGRAGEAVVAALKR